MKTTRYLLSALSVCVAIAASSSALAQSADLDSNTPVFDRARPDYDAKGLPLGAFRVKPTLNVEENYRNNIYATETNAKSDYITSVKPALDINSDWSRHELNFHADGDFNHYQNHNDESNNNYGAGLDGRLDILRETFVTGEATYNLRHEDRGDPNSSSSTTKPTEYGETVARLGIFRGVRRVSAKLDGEYKNLNYKNGKTSTGAVVDENDRDRDEYKGTLRLGYEFLPDYEAFIRGSLNTRNYDAAINPGNVNRDSDGYDVAVGTALNFSGKTRGEVYAGWMEQSYDDASLHTVKGATYGADVTWNATALTSVLLNASRSIEETTQANASAYINTSYGIEVQHELMRNILLGATASYTQNDYQGGSSTRKDDYTKAGLNGKYLLSRNISLKASYDYTDRNSNVSGQDYTDHSALVGVGVAF